MHVKIEETVNNLKWLGNMHTVVKNTVCQKIGLDC
jgi:hypothetical protein